MLIFSFLSLSSLSPTVGVMRGSERFGKRDPDKGHCHPGPQLHTAGGLCIGRPVAKTHEEVQRFREKQSASVSERKFQKGPPGGSK